MTQRIDWPQLVTGRFALPLLLSALFVAGCSEDVNGRNNSNAATASAQNTTSGGCSPVVDRTAGNVAVTLNCSFGGAASDSFNVQLVRAQLACNSDQERNWTGDPPGIRPAPEFFSTLRGLHDQFVYLDLAVLIGSGGCGISDVPERPGQDRWGAVFELNSDNLDSFPGNRNAYEYGYQIEYGEPQRPESEDLPRFWSAMLLFPNRDRDSAFLTVNYMRAFVVEGLAKIRVTDIQGLLYIEIIPAPPAGSLAEHYSRLRLEVERLRNAG